MRTLSRILMAPIIMAGALGTAQAQETYTYGDHVYTMKGNLTIERYNANATGTVTFTNVPAGIDEFTR